MGPRRPGDRTLLLVAAGVFGVFLAHVLDYVLLFRSAAARSQALAASGHGWWPDAVGAAIGAGAIAAGMALARGGTGAVLRQAATPRQGRPSWRDLGWLVLWQVTLFGAVEVAERLAAHQSPVHLLRSPVLSVGVALQLLVAAVVLVALRLLERVGATLVDAAAGVVRRPRRTRRPAFARTLDWGLPGRPPAGPPEARGPPTILAV